MGRTPQDLVKGPGAPGPHLVPGVLWGSGQRTLPTLGHGFPACRVLGNHWGLSTVQVSGPTPGALIQWARCGPSDPETRPEQKPVLQVSSWWRVQSNQSGKVPYPSVTRINYSQL